MTTRLVAASQGAHHAWRRFARRTLGAAAVSWHKRELKIDRSHDEQTAKNVEASSQQAAVRERARQVAMSRVGRPLTAPGPSHRAPEPGPVPRVQTQAELAKEAVRQTESRALVRAHAERLKEKEALRVAQLEEQQVARRKAHAIQRGEGRIC